MNEERIDCFVQKTSHMDIELCQDKDRNHYLNEDTSEISIMKGAACGIADLHQYIPECENLQILEQFSEELIERNSTTVIDIRVIKNKYSSTKELEVKITIKNKHGLHHHKTLHYQKPGYDIKQLKILKDMNCIVFLSICNKRKESYLVFCDLNEFSEKRLEPIIAAESKSMMLSIIHKCNDNSIVLRAGKKKDSIEVFFERCTENIFDLDTADEGLHINLYLKQERLRNDQLTKRLFV